MKKLALMQGSRWPRGGIATSLLLSLLLADPLSGQEDPPEFASPRIARLATAVQSGDWADIGAFWSEVSSHGTPLVEDGWGPGGNVVTFVVRDARSDVRYALESGVSALLAQTIGEHAAAATWLTGLDGTDLHFLTLEVPSDLRAPYAFRRHHSDGSSERFLDPFAREEHAPGTRWARSVVAGERAPGRPWRSHSAQGRWETVVLVSQALGGERSFEVYLPESYSAGRSTPFPVLLAMDGFGYKEPLLPASRILEFEIANEALEPTVLVLTEDLGPIGDAGSYAPAIEFVVDEVLPLVADRFNVSRLASQRTVLGASRRGMLAALIAFERPDAVARAVSFSGAFYWSPPGEDGFEWLTHRFASERARPIRLFVSVGEMETLLSDRNRGHYPLSTNRHFRDVLLAKEYEFAYREFSGVHSEVNWEVELAQALRWLGDR